MHIVVDESWREETGIYLKRLNDALTISDEWGGSFKKYWPGCFFSTHDPTNSAAIALRLGIYATNIFSTSLQASGEIENQWGKGIFVLVPLSARFLLESWGSVHFSRITLTRLIEHNDIEREENRVNRLTHGSILDKESKVVLPFGGETDTQSFNVMNFIDSLSDVGDQPKIFYNFLCEACHPNFVQSSYFQLAGPTLPNWSNDSYKELGHQVLEKTVKAIEFASSGIQSDILYILETATQYIEDENEMKKA